MTSRLLTQSSRSSGHQNTSEASEGFLNTYTDEKGLLDRVFVRGTGGIKGFRAGRTFG